MSLKTEFVADFPDPPYDAAQGTSSAQPMTSPRFPEPAGAIFFH
jgi:hypothetical protein